MRPQIVNEADLLIVGGGPAGLLAAAYMAERWRVALIDRGVVGRTTKYWVTSARRLKMHGLAHCTLNKPPGLVVGTFLGGAVRAAGDLAVVDDRALLETLVGRCRDAGVHFEEGCSLLNLAWTENHIDAQTTTGRYRTRLVIDATGGFSPIAATFRLHRLDGFYAVYGAHLRNINLHSADIVLAYVDHLGDPPPILEVVPSGEGSAYCAVFTYSRQLTKPQSLETMFRTYCRHNDFFSMTPQTEIGQARMGAIPIGSVRTRQLPGVALIGEAALVQPPLLGTAFNEILEYSRPVCSHLSRILSQASGVPTAPRYQYPLLKRVQDSLQLEMTRLLLRGNVEAFDRLARFAKSLPEPMVYNLFSNELSWLGLMSAAARLPTHLLLSWR